MKTVIVMNSMMECYECSAYCECCAFHAASVFLS